MSAASQQAELPPVTTPPPSRPRLKRRVAVAVTLSVLLGAGVAAYTLTNANDSSVTATPGAPPPPRVTVAAVEQRVLTEYEELTGRVDALESVELRPRVSGHIDAVHFQSGQLVRAGDLLFTIDPRWYRAQADLARAEVERARSRAGIAEREAKRADELLAQKAISVEEADTRRANHAAARAELLAADARLATARLDLEHTEVRAPIAGRVSRAFVTPGNLVSGSPGNATVLTSIVSTDDAYVYADVDELTVLKFNQLLRDGQLALQDGRVPVELQLGDEAGFPHHGFIESVDNRLDPATGSLTVRMIFANPDGVLVPGLFARVRLPISEPRTTLLVSERAIGTDQSQKFVLTVGEDNTVAYRPVKTGPSLDGRRIVRDGLQAGERIVVNGLQRVRPGMTVTPETAAVAATPTATAELAKH